MFEFLAELIFSTIFEAIAHVIGGFGKSAKATPARTASSERSSGALAIKLALALVGGAFWGNYVARTSDVDLPLTIWSFLTLALVTGLLASSEASTEQWSDRWARRLRFPPLRRVLTYTPQHFRELAAVSLVAAAAVVVSFFLS